MDYTDIFNRYLQGRIAVTQPGNLYEPVHYIMNMPAKRLRPHLMMCAADGYGAEMEKVLPAALAIELFHNFTLLHDDVMDHAGIRRGMPTVHKKWNINTAILSGDVTLIRAYEELEAYPDDIFRKIIHVFNRTAREVCEGQQYDMDFESNSHISQAEYLKMIRLKTAVLPAASLQIGAIISGVSAEEQNKIYDFGIQLGIAFQLQDDFLDTFGNVAKFGKKIGGDILENKKTLLYVLTLQHADEQDKKYLTAVYSGKTGLTETEKINTVTGLFRKYGVDKLITGKIAEYTNTASGMLHHLNLSGQATGCLENLLQKLSQREK